MNRNITSKARLGMVNFINTAPVYIPWQENGAHEDWNVIEGTPTELNELLRKGDLDAGLISSYAFGLDHEGYILLPDLGISATGAVGSVLLFSKVSIRELDGRIVGLTPQSATSVNLLRIILERFLGVSPRYRTGCFREFEQGEAAAYLSIGDEALQRRSEQSDFYQYDLAEIWLEQTGMPFVFAVCAVRRDIWQTERRQVLGLGEKLAMCRDRGAMELDRISSMVAGRIPMDAAECLKYLRGIELDLSAQKQRGLLHFFKVLAGMYDFPEISDLRIVKRP